VSSAISRSNSSSKASPISIGRPSVYWFPSRIILERCLNDKFLASASFNGPRAQDCGIGRLMRIAPIQRDLPSSGGRGSAGGTWHPRALGLPCVPSLPKLPFNRRVAYCFLFFAHLASAAFRALALLSSGVSLAARVFPPFEPPILPKATACGFFLCMACQVLCPRPEKRQGERKCLTMRKRVRIIVMRRRLRMSFQQIPERLSIRGAS
jgi:hypothetical protein